MITYIIPIIHPDHERVLNYSDVTVWLEKTLQSIKKHSVPTQVIVVCHKPLENVGHWEKRNVIFIQVKSRLFELLKELDSRASKGSEDTNKQEGISNYKPFSDYLNLKGEYHNKDKGLKYFIGLLYCSLLPPSKKPSFVGLIDGDDYLHIDIGKWLLREAPRKCNLFAIETGYMVFSDGIIDDPEHHYKRLVVTGCYPLVNFSQLCGSNRFLRYSFLKDKIRHRLNYNFGKDVLQRFYSNKYFGPEIAKQFAYQVSRKPRAWSILPMFLGNHRLLRSRTCQEPPHPFQKFFNIGTIPFPAAIKFVHNTNHSCGDTQDLQSDIVNRYCDTQLIPAQSKDSITDFFPIAKLFAIGPYMYLPKTIQNSL